MSITLKTNQIKLKIQNGNYQAPVVIADQTTSEHVAEVNTAITTTGNQQVSAIQTKGDEVLDSIPEDYTDLVEEVDELKSAFNTLQPAATVSDVGKFLKAKTVEDGVVTEYEFGEGGGLQNPEVGTYTVVDGEAGYWRNGSATPASRWYHKSIAVQPGQSLYVSCNGNSFVQPYYIVKSDGVTVVSSAGVEAETTYTHQLVTIPSEGAYLILNGSATDGVTSYWFNIWTTSVVQIDTKDYVNNANIVSMESINILDWSKVNQVGSYSVGTGAYSSTSGFLCTKEFIPITGGVTIYGTPSQAYSDQQCLVVFFDSTCSFISGDGFLFSHGINAKTELSVPATASYVKISYNANLYPSLKVAISYEPLDEYIDYNNHKVLTIPVKAGSIGIDALNTSLATLVKSGGKLDGKTIVNFGDSIFAMGRDTENDISSYLHNMTNATFYNVAVGGTRMSRRGSGTLTPEQDAWSAFSMYALADAVCANDFSYQNASYTYDTTLENVSKQALTTLKSIDFSEVDMITIAFGTNDYTGGTPIPDTNDTDDITTYIGAFKYIVKKFQTAYPKIRVLAITPIWRHFTSQDGGQYNYAGTGVLTDYVTALVNCCESLRIPVLHSYTEMSLSWQNSDYYMSADDPASDKVHLSPAGREMYAHLINGKIGTLY